MNVSFKTELLCLSLYLGTHKNTFLYTGIRGKMLILISKDKKLVDNYLLPTVMTLLSMLFACAHNKHKMYSIVGPVRIWTL